MGELREVIKSMFEIISVMKNTNLDSETVKELAKVFSDASVCSVMYRGSKYFKIQIDENMAKFKCSERGLVVGLGNGFILVAETDGPSNPLCNCVVALNHVLQALNNAQIGQ
ncbi:uncharacterized protein LOC106878099 isoform X2 [Octopus bimaculoides]|uniref:uncharacterized protein LOC106878099 isoform X2 n=1 Tax=Octopus bimaculoides TaxID=37653 RepID=UPI0022E39DA0|nr:uncharacterized protein LOC106878099 isoform X2 [Octopus bimaculoides]